MRNRFAEGVLIWIGALLIFAGFKSWIGLPLGGFLAYCWLWWTTRTKRPTAWHWENLKQPFNALLVGGVIGLHVGIQIFLTYIGLDLELHLITFFSVAPIHIATVLISVLEKPPKPNREQIIRKRKRSLIEWFLKD